MAEPFASSRSTLAWAKENLFPDLDKRIREFHNLNPYAKVVESDPQAPGWEIHKIKLVKQFPEAFGQVAKDLLTNLRSVLDMAGYSIAVAIGKPDAKSTAFPFANSVDNMRSSIGRAGDLPKEVQSFFCGFQPYPGGDDLLWALNELCNSSKHKFVTPMATVMHRGRAAARGFGRPFSMPDPHVWDGAKDEMVVVRFGPMVVPNATWDYDFDFFPFIAFNQIVTGEPVLGVLYELCLKVESILAAIEAESRRLGIVK